MEGEKILPKEHWPTGHQANYYLSIFTSTLNIYSPASLELEIVLYITHLSGRLTTSDHHSFTHQLSSYPSIPYLSCIQLASIRSSSTFHLYLTNPSAHHPSVHYPFHHLCIVHYPIFCHPSVYYLVVIHPPIYLLSIPLSSIPASIYQLSIDHHLANHPVTLSALPCFATVSLSSLGMKSFQSLQASFILLITDPQTSLPQAFLTKFLHDSQGTWWYFYLLATLSLPSTIVNYLSFGESGIFIRTEGCYEDAMGLLSPACGPQGRLFLSFYMWKGTSA